jgi:ferric-dicitrate binding protein FerR (iron transport regulator)
MGKMTDARDPEMSDPVPPAAGDDIAPLLRLAGPREPVPADRLRRIEGAARAEWQQQARSRSRRRAMVWTGGAVAAAVVLVAVRFGVKEGVVVPSPPRELATIEVLHGAVQPIAQSAGAGAPALSRIGDLVRAGDGIDTTTGGRAILRLARGARVRVDRGSRMRLLTDTTLLLDQGAIYVESGPGADGGGLEVRTAIGTVTDIGTRFEVRLVGAALRVRVRDGAVRLAQSGESHDARAGDELTLDGSGRTARRRLPPFGPDWAWIADLPQPFALEGRTLFDFLDWIAAEHGWQLRFVDSGAERKARATTLHGSIEGLTPGEALDAVVPTSGVACELQAGVLQVSLTAGRTKG